MKEIAGRGAPDRSGVAALARAILYSAVGAGLVFGAMHARADEALSDFRTKLSKWVETRQITSEERSDWEVERETLQATRQLLEREKKGLAEEIAELESTTSAADDERRDLLLRRGELQQSTLALESSIRGLEEQVLALAPRFPEPLRKKVEPLLVQIPKDAESARGPLGPRLMNVLGVLAQAEKFNDTASFVGETRAVGGADQKVQVRTLYWGLAQAVYVDSQGKTAGIGRPGPDGWTFTDRPELVPDAQLLLDIYEGNTDTIDFVPIPVEAN